LPELAFGGICVPSSKYHREQAKVLAGLALSTHDAREADRFNLAAMQHLEQAQVVDDAAKEASDAIALCDGDMGERSAEAIRLNLPTLPHP
jgi:hypothetical protein